MMDRKDRKGSEVWLYGIHSVAAALEARPGEARELMAASARRLNDELAQRVRSLRLPLKTVPEHELARVCGSGSHQGVAVRTPLPGYVAFDRLIERRPSLLVVLDGITDPQNLGAIARTAEALGAGGMILAKDRAAGLSPAAHKVSAGALEWLPVCQAVNLARTLRDLKQAGYWLYGADPGGSMSLAESDFSGLSALVVGSEGKGIRPGVKKELDLLIRIEQKGKTPSLNAAQASAIIMAKILKAVAA